MGLLKMILILRTSMIRCIPGPPRAREKQFFSRLYPMEISASHYVKDNTWKSDQSINKQSPITVNLMTSIYHHL